MRLSTATVLLLALVAGCSEFKGPRAPADGLNYPVGVAVHPSGRWLYVANANFDGRYRADIGGTVVVVDAETLEVVPESTVEIGSFAGGLALSDGFGRSASPDRLYVTVRGDDSLVALAVSEDGRTLSCPNASERIGAGLACRVFVARNPFAVVPLDPREGGRQVDEDVDLIAVAGIDGSVSYVALGTDSSGRFALADATVKSGAVVNGASAARYFAPTSELWVAGRFSRRIRGLRHIFDPRDGTSAEVIDFVVRTETAIPSTLDAAEVRDVVFSEDGERAYLSLNRPSSIMVLDMTRDAEGQARGTVLERFDVDGAPAQLVLTRESGRPILYVALTADQAIAVYDAETGTLLDSIQLDGLAYGLAHDAGTGRMYVTLFDERAVVAIDLDPASPSFRHVVRRSP